jgi:cation transport ATPase
MKTKTILLSLLAIITMSSGSTAQKKKETILIKTSAQCDMCKKRIEDAVYAIVGVKSAELNVKTAELKVIFNNTKTNSSDIRNTISKLGYDADNVKADHDAYNKLPPCCQKSGHHH